MRSLEYLYQPDIDKSLWAGRSDAKDSEYLFQVIKFLDLNNLSNTALVNGGFALLGFCCDEGVRRNFGRTGSKSGPDVFRKVIARLPLHNTIMMYDVGNVVCHSGDLEAAQAELGLRIQQIFKIGLQPIVIGGGHETAFGHYQGINNFYNGDEVAILNFDAHFDLRDLLPGDLGSSGTPFRQIHNLLRSQQQKFYYYCAGIQKQANTSSLFAYAAHNHVEYITSEKINRNPYDLDWIEKIISKHRHLYVTICLDVFNAAVAPGVSAPQPLGITPTYVLESLKLLKKSKKVLSLDIVEFAPKFDIQEHTAKLAGSLFFNYCMLTD